MAHSEHRTVKEKPEVTSYKESLSTEAEKLVFENFPLKIQKLTEALQGDMFNVSDFTTLHWSYKLPPPPPLPPPSSSPSSSTVPNGLDTLPEDDQPAAKKRKVDETGAESGDFLTVSVGPKLPAKFSGVIPCNPKLTAIIDFMKPEIISLVDQCNKLKMWIQLMIPKIEDGNNFGVSIQEDVLAEVSKAETDAGSYLEQMSRYFGFRAKLVSKVAKYPFLDDYRRGVNEYDEKVFLSFKLMLRELRNIYVVLYDMIVKNYEKIVHPRTSNTSSLY